MSDIEARVAALEIEPHGPNGVWPCVHRLSARITQTEQRITALDGQLARLSALERGAAGAAVPASSTLFNMLDASIAGLACLLAKEEEEQANLCGQLESFAATIIHECLKRPAAGAAKARYVAKQESHLGWAVMECAPDGDDRSMVTCSYWSDNTKNKADAERVAAALEAMEPSRG